MKIQLPHLETNVTAACQNRCVGCNHFVPLTAKNPTMLDPEVLRRDVMHFSRVAHVAKYGMLGGEPTLHPRLAELIRIVKQSGIADLIEVWTNGQRIAERRITPEFWQAPFDVLVVSAYPGKMTDADIEFLSTECQAHGKRMELKDERKQPFFRQLLKPAVTVGRATQETYDQCWFKTFSRVLDNGFFYRCCTSPYIPKLLLGLPEGTDGLRVDEQLTVARLQEFLNQRTPMASCGICAGINTPHSVPLKWGEERDPEKWLALSSGR